MMLAVRHHREALIAIAVQIFAQAIKDDHCVVDAVTDDGQNRRQRQCIDLPQPATRFMIARNESETSTSCTSATTAATP